MSAPNRNRLNHLGIDIETACRWDYMFNTWKWAEDFPIPMPEGWDKLSDPDKFKNVIFKICCEGIRGLIPEEDSHRYWHKHQLRKTDEEFEQYLLHQHDEEWLIWNYYNMDESSKEEAIRYVREQAGRQQAVTTYGYAVHWTNFGGTKGVAEVSDMPTPQEAYRETLAFAIRCGWTPPRWWQFWRWSDTRPIEPEHEANPLTH